MNFLRFLFTYVTLAMIANLFTYRFVSSVVDNFISPLINIIINDDLFRNYNIHFDKNLQVVLVTTVNTSKTISYSFNFGVILKECITWLIVMFTLFTISRFTEK